MTPQSSLERRLSTNSSSILKGKHAVVFGAGGSVGAAVAKDFATEGAEVFLAGRTKSSVEAVAKQITKDGGRAHAHAIDALDDATVNEYIDYPCFKSTGPSKRTKARCDTRTRQPPSATTLKSCPRTSIKQ